MTKILLTGSAGQVGQELQQVFTNAEVIAVARERVDFTQPETLRQIVQEVQPQVIINAAAYTAVDKAESEPEQADAVNALAPAILAQESQKLGVYLIHISTDYVFDGKNGYPYQETDNTNPASTYGRTKLAGEQAVQENCNNYIILRTAWVYGTYGKSNFVKTMLRLGGEREEIRVVADQIGSPTWAKHLAQAIAQLIPHLTPEIAGTYHYTNSGVASWYDFAVAIFEEAKHVGFPLKVQRIIPITTAEYPTPAHRPAYSVLSCGKISAVMGTYPPHWRQGLRQMLLEYIGDESFNSLRR
ncbi:MULTISPECIES: dTDP-4-dehydrorhamnose reductase [unclassified Coleofasciculus]|uniref:dTDP-4-dehydrorhamnose reductase n=1 Tax=Cyanophyceae TaxID=3028117 RepID=UPI0016899758|nr:MULTISPECIES: dTDP-4-dehydrorhamnose reductase [unclassified Coleofasciculus]MBD2083702.1 dTDP-4-dehydrorhamnose reductase [Coleofasciculus sp. FACHB-542]MBD2537885.1 dTDP-4-dehydrorhamnose reductase [Coleofasciculus sp. FACHB-SPT36]